VKVPTTHDHPDGVAAGIVAGLERLMREHTIAPEAVAFIAHSTTQATNALLEGDVAHVGIVRFGPAFARASMRFAPVPLAAATPGSNAHAQPESTRSLPAKRSPSIGRSAKTRSSRALARGDLPPPAAARSRRCTDCGRERAPPR
jgi:hypothetical protein